MSKLIVTWPDQTFTVQLSDDSVEPLKDALKRVPAEPRVRIESQDGSFLYLNLGEARCVQLKVTDD